MSFAELLIWGAVAGIGATVFTDVIGVLRQGWRATNGFYGLVGRWIGLLPRAGFAHDDIRTSPPVAAETVLGWAAHALLGVVFGIGFALLFGAPALEAPQLWQGLSFGLGTVLVPWLIFQPLFGWGFAVSKTPEPCKMRMKGVITHSVFGVGLWLSALVLRAII